MVLGVDRIVDMARTVLNISGDLMATAVVAGSEGALDRAVLGEAAVAPAGGGTA
jgi:Na+/H+-dicarboxylate symporter